MSSNETAFFWNLNYFVAVWKYLLWLLKKIMHPCFISIIISLKNVYSLLVKEMKCVQTKSQKWRSWRNTLKNWQVLCFKSYRVFLLLNSSLLSDLVFMPGGKVKKPTFPQESSERWIWHKMTSSFICLSISNSTVCSNQKAGCTIQWDSFWNLSAWNFLKMTCTHSTSCLWSASENLCKTGLCLSVSVKTDTTADPFNCNCW